MDKTCYLCKEEVDAGDVCTEMVNNGRDWLCKWCEEKVENDLHKKLLISGRYGIDLKVFLSEVLKRDYDMNRWYIEDQDIKDKS